MNRMRTLRPPFSEEYNDLKEYDFPLASSTEMLSHFPRSFLLGRAWETLISPLQMPAESSSGGGSVDFKAGSDDGGIEVASADGAMVATSV